MQMNSIHSPIFKTLGKYFSQLLYYFRYYNNTNIDSQETVHRERHKYSTQTHMKDLLGKPPPSLLL